MKKTSRSHHATLNELNITPLLDLAFVLLVIFIITTPQLVNYLEMALPSGDTPPPTETPPPKPDIQRIAIEASGQILLNNVPITVPALNDALASLRAANPEVAVVVQGADDVDYQNMVSVFDVLRQLDITKVGLATQDSPTR